MRCEGEGGGGGWVDYLIKYNEINMGRIFAFFRPNFKISKIPAENLAVTKFFADEKFQILKLVTFIRQYF